MFIRKKSLENRIKTFLLHPHSPVGPFLELPQFTPACLPPPHVHVLFHGPCGGKVRPLWPSLHLHLGVFLPLQRMTDTDGLRETPHRSSVADGMGGPNPPSVIRSGWYRKMGLGIRGRTDRYGDPKTDRTAVQSL
jgi:hypothetical protein